MSGISSKRKNGTVDGKSTKSAKRHQMHNTDDDETQFETNNIQSVVAEKLTEILDQHMELVSRRRSHDPVKKDNSDEGVKLFSSSSGSLTTEPQLPTYVQKKRTYSTSSNSSEEERLAESAVTQDFIFNKRTFSSDTSTVSKPEQQNNQEIAINNVKKKSKKRKKTITTDSTS